MMFVASLAIADFCLGVFIAFPLSLPILATSQWAFNDATCQFQGYVAITLACASIHTLTLMAVNRYFRIVRPAKYWRFFTKKKTTIMIFVSNPLELQLVLNVEEIKVARTLFIILVFFNLC